MKALITILAFGLGTSLFGHAQDKKSVVIGTMIDKPNAILVINPPNGNQGFLLPQLNTTQRLSILPVSPQDDGLMIFDITDNAFYYWSSNAWIKGLGDNTAQILGYDAATQKLTLNNGGGEVDLNTLKEIPSPVGNTGKYLTTDGTTLSWTTGTSLGDITAITAGQGLTGSATFGDVNLSVSADGTTIDFNGSNQLQVADGSITPAKIDSPGSDQVLVTDAAGNVTWEARSNFVDDNQGLQLQAGNVLAIDNGGSANLNGLNAGGQITGTLNNLSITSGSVTNAQLATLAVATPNLVDAAVTPQKISPSSTDNRVLTTVGGTVVWVDPATVSILTDGLTIAGNGTTGNELRVPADGISANQIQSNAVGVSELADNSVDGASIQAKVVDPTKITPGGPNQVLVTNGAGTDATWVNQNTLTPGAAADGVTITGNGTTGNELEVGVIGTANIGTEAVTSGQIANGTISTADIAGNAITNAQILDATILTADLADNAVDISKLADNSVTSGQIIDGTIAGADILDDAVLLSKIQPGLANQVLVMNGAGTDPQWINQTALVPSVLSDGVTITGNGTTGNELEVGVIGTANIGTDAVTSGQIANGTISTTDIAGNAVTNAQILDGTIVTADLADDAVDINKLANNSVVTANILDGTIISADIADETIVSADILDGTIATADLANSSVTEAKIRPGTANQILATDAGATTAVWIGRGTLPVLGDVTGTLAATTVEALRGRPVAATAPNVGDALIWNGTAWAPAGVTASPVRQYSSIDPSSFTVLEPGGGTVAGLGIFEGDNTFVTARNAGQEIMAPLNLPHGATIENLTVFYTDNDLGSLTVRIIRKPYDGTNEVLSTFTSGLLTLVIQQQLMTIPPAQQVVDNLNYTYRIQVVFGNILPTNSPVLVLEKIHGIRIQYMK